MTTEPNPIERSHSLTAIGTISTPFKRAAGTPIQGALCKDIRGEIALFPEYQDGILDVDGFSHLVLIYLFDRIANRKLKVIPYLDDQERGIFATRSPARPNPIGMTVVQLNRVQGQRLIVSGVDMLDNTPLLDIKPYVPEFDQPKRVRRGWFERHLDRIEAETTVPVADDRFHRPGSKV